MHAIIVAQMPQNGPEPAAAEALNSPGGAKAPDQKQGVIAMRLVPIALAAAGALAMLAASMPAQARSPHHPRRVVREHVWHRPHWHPRHFVYRHPVPVRRGFHIVGPHLRVTIR